LRKQGMDPGRIGAILAKDLREFSRDRLWMILTPLSLALVTAVFLLLPDGGGSIGIGVYPGSLADAFDVPGAPEVRGTRIIMEGFASEAALEEAVLDDDGGLSLGLALPEDFLSDLLTGDIIQVRIYLAGSLPPGLERAFRSGVREMGYAARAVLEGRDPLSLLPVSIPDLDAVLSMDGNAAGPAPMKVRLRPMVIVMVLLVESLALAGLVAAEIEGGTVTALLVSPATTEEFLAAKCALGILLAAIQAFLFILVTGSLGLDWAVISALLVIGACLSSAVGMLAGSGGRDFIGTMFYSLIFLIPLMLPVFSAVFPGRPPLPVRLVPSYGLVQCLYGTLVRGDGWKTILPHALATAAWAAVLLTAALMVLKRRVRSL